MYAVEWPLINFINANYIVWRIICSIHVFDFHKGGQTNYKATILPSQRCCHDNRARHSRPLRDGEQERKWKDVEGRYKMMSKLKQNDETGEEETMRKSEPVIKSRWRDNGMKGPQIWEKERCPQVLAQQSHWLFMLDTLKQCRKPAGPFSGLCVGSPRPQLWERIEAPADRCAAQPKAGFFSFLTHVLLCTYAETHVVHVIYATKREIKHAEKPRRGKTGPFIGLLLLFNNPLIRLFASPLVIKGVYCDWSIGKQTPLLRPVRRCLLALTSQFVSSSSHLNHNGLNLPAR